MLIDLREPIKINPAGKGGNRFHHRAKIGNQMQNILAIQRSDKSPVESLQRFLRDLIGRAFNLSTRGVRFSNRGKARVIFTSCFDASATEFPSCSISS